MCATEQSEPGGEIKHSNQAAVKGTARTERSWGRVGITQESSAKPDCPLSNICLAVSLLTVSIQ